MKHLYKNTEQLKRKGLTIGVL